MQRLFGWKCKACSVTSPEDVSKCLACGVTKDSENDSVGAAATTSTPSTNAGAGTIGSGGFSFLGSSSSSDVASLSLFGGAVGLNAFAPNSASTSKATADLFKLKQGEWRGGQCSCKNSANCNKCEECNKPRADGGDKKIGATPVNDKNASIGAGGFSFGRTALPPSGGGGAITTPASGFHRDHTDNVSPEDVEHVSPIGGAGTEVLAGARANAVYSIVGDEARAGAEAVLVCAQREPVYFMFS